MNVTFDHDPDDPIFAHDMLDRLLRQVPQGSIARVSITIEVRPHTAENHLLPMQLRPIFHRRRLSQLMAERRLTQQKLATSIGVAQATISAWTKGRQVPTLDKIDQLAQYFTVPITELWSK